jgi:4'-phosphopantetheinyl transferase
MSRADVSWLLQSFGDPPLSDTWLTDDEALTLAGLRFAKRRHEWRLGRWTAKRAVALLARSMGERPPSPERVAIRAAADGAPEVFLSGVPANLSVSISHRNGIAVCALSRSGAALGCDLEEIEPRSNTFVRDYFADPEVQMYERALERDRPGLATLVWSAKESALKALRTGLRSDTRSVVVQLNGRPGEAGWSPLTIQAADEPRPLQGWWMQGGGHVLTMVATQDPDPPTFLG